jgi:hypothetical protein
MYELQKALEELLGRPLSPVSGYDTRALIAAADAGAVDTLLCLGGNLWGANPNSAEAKRALARIDTIVYLATKPNQGHFHGLAASNTLVLPVFNRFETPHLPDVNYVGGSRQLRRRVPSLSPPARAGGGDSEN